MAVAPGSNPGSRVVSTDDATIIGQVVLNPDGSAIGGSGAGNATAANQVLQLAQETATANVSGTTAGAAVITDSNGTIQQYLRGLVKLIVAKITVVIDQTTPGTTNAVSATNFPATVSVNTGATGASSPRVTVAGDSATVAGSASLPAGSNVIGKTSIDQTTPGTTNKVDIGTNGTVAVTGVSTSAKQDSLLAAITKVGAVTVVGITEVDAYTTGANGNHTISAGALAISVNFSSDFTGTVLGATYAASTQGVSISRVAQPGNLLPAMAITRSAGTYDYYVVTPT